MYERLAVVLGEDIVHPVGSQETEYSNCTTCKRSHDLPVRALSSHASGCWCPEQTARHEQFISHKVFHPEYGTSFQFRVF